LPLNTRMSFKVSCYTLFDITQTGVINRSRPGIEDDPNLWLYRRNTQCNFDTILQVISLRSQPEIVDSPKQVKIKFTEFDKFGFLFQDEDDTEHNCWTFSFYIQHPSVVYDGITDLGYLYADCDQVPMIKTDTVWNKLPAFLDTSDELRNIYFKVLEDDN
jgi:hypothetical protein